MKKVYITGIAGLIGSNLAKALLIKGGYSIRGCDNFIGGYKDNIPEGCIYNYLDILNTKEVSFYINMFKPDIVVHAAALAYEGLSVFSPAIVTKNIYSGTVSVASAAITNNVDLFINCSSMARYGNGNPPFKETDELKPQDPYGLAKVQAEQMLELLSDIHGLKYYTVVPHNIVGKGQVYTDPYRNVAAIFTNRILLGKPILIYGDGEQKRSFSVIGTCIDAIIKLIESERFPSGEVFNIGPEGNEISIIDLAYLVGHHCGIQPILQHYPDRPQEVKNAWCSSQKAIKELNYNPGSSNDAAIKEIVAWVRERGPEDFKYHLSIEIKKDNTPETWVKELI